jgi:uncharacterized protein YjiS (DUF1127 family)
MALKQMIQAFFRLMDKRRTYVELSTLDDRMLRDIGLRRDPWDGRIRPC